MSVPGNAAVGIWRHTAVWKQAIVRSEQSPVLVMPLNSPKWFKAPETSAGARHLAKLAKVTTWPVPVHVSGASVSATKTQSSTAWKAAPALAPIRRLKAVRTGRANLAALWLGFHVEQERKFARRLKAVWQEVGAEVLKAIRPAIEAGLTGHAVVQASLSGLNLENLLIDTAAEELQRTMRAAAVREMKLYAPRKLYQRWRTKENKEVPPEVAAAILLLANELLRRGNWTRIISTYRDDIVEAIRRGTVRADAAEEIMVSLSKLLGPEGSTSRAIRIARTETTSGLNSGQAAGRIPLRNLGLIATKEWLGILDNLIRDSHEEADGQVVAYKDFFTVGGELARWPGDPNLSAAQRANCRCSSLVHLVRDSGFERISDEEALAIFGR